MDGLLAGVIAIVWFIAVFIAVFALLTEWGEKSDILSKRKKSIDGRSKKQDNIEELNDTFYNRFFAPIVNQGKEYVEKINSADVKAGNKSKAQLEIERKLKMAGLDISVEGFTFYKYAFIFAVVVVTSFIVMIQYFNRQDTMILLLILIVGILLAIVAPGIFLNTKAKSRQSKLRDQLPDALDLLGVCIEAGLSFDNSLLKVAEKLEGPFIDELMNVYREIQMGVPRNDALKKLSDGSDIPELKTFISALIQANQLGIPINNVMQVQSAQLRDTRKERAKEKGAKAPVLMLIPMILFIFPVLFIMLMAPTVMNIMEMF